MVEQICYTSSCIYLGVQGYRDEITSNTIMLSISFGLLTASSNVLRTSSTYITTQVDTKSPYIIGYFDVATHSADKALFEEVLRAVTSIRGV